ncbi:nicotinate-nucleotide adenylyltransferase [Actinomarinicola tropica]|uniref:nicotinate-nucleotide adenylyltransferase n=1 Tax=Actinomarinicola tropica TaxID=2789776 RepID=UPI00189A7D48|nr:nicotinate-nucleotide adenylyltransferase [Actinomarinicola tropica]
MGRRERVGIFGGTFDPPHVGHLVAALNARHGARLDRVLLVVANEPWQKLGVRDLSPAADRLAMVDAAVDGVEGLAASDIEIRRGGRSYTADTLAQLHDELPGADLFLILGSDAVAGLPTWEHTERLKELADIVVVDRPGTEGARPPEGYRYEVVEVPQLEISSTDIRARVRDGRPLDYLLPRDVIACVLGRGLYRDGA